jgi:chromosome segregation ATPase
MKITGVRANGVRGQSVDIKIDSSLTAVVGKMGSGKSTVLDSIALCLLVPTKYGSQGLDRLSPTGAWAVDMSFDDPEVRTLRRSVGRTGSAHAVNGRKVSAKEYAEAVKKLLDVEPYHCNLGEFLGMSGQKRSEMFGKALEAGTHKTVAEVLEAVGAMGVDELFRAELGDETVAEGGVAEIIDRLTSISGTPTALVDGVRQVAAEANQDDNKATTSYERLVEQSGGISHGMDAPELEARIQEADKEIGGIEASIRDIERDRERYDEAAKLVESKKRDVERLHEEVARLEVSAAEYGDPSAINESYEAAMAAVESQKEVVAAHRKDCEQCNENWLVEREALSVAKSKLDSAKKLSSVDRSGIDRKWVLSQYCELAGIPDCIAHEENEATGSLFNGVVDFAIRVVQGIHGGTEEDLAAEYARRDSAAAAAQQAYAASKDNLEDAERVLLDKQDVAQDAAKRLEAARKVAIDLPEARAKAQAAAEDLAPLNQALSRTAVPEDEAVLTDQVAALEEVRSSLRKQLQELQDNNAIVGQIEEARLRKAVASAAAKVVKEVLGMVQNWRDAEVGRAIEGVMAPFSDRFKAMFGDGTEVFQQTIGTGRTTEFNFSISRGGTHVPLDLLSDGEAVLASAAFLTALQSLKPGPGSLLLIHDTGLDDEGCERFMSAALSLGVDHIFIATSRVAAESVGAGWQVVQR